MGDERIIQTSKHDRLVVTHRGRYVTVSRWYRWRSAPGGWSPDYDAGITFSPKHLGAVIDALQRCCPRDQHMSSADVGRCTVEWRSPRSGQPIQCALDEGHIGEHWCAGWWRDVDERAWATNSAVLHQSAEQEKKT